MAMLPSIFDEKFQLRNSEFLSQFFMDSNEKEFKGIQFMEIEEKPLKIHKEISQFWIEKYDLEISGQRN